MMKIDYKQYDIKNNPEVYLYLVSSFTPIDIVLVNYYEETSNAFKMLGYFMILEDETNRYVFYYTNTDNEIYESIIKEIFYFINENKNVSDNINKIFENEVIKEHKDKLSLTYFDDITFSRFFELIETEYTDLVYDESEINERLKTINDNDYELPEFSTDFYLVIEKKYVRTGPSSRIKNPVVPVLKTITSKKGTIFQRTYYVKRDKLEKKIKNKEISPDDIGMVSEKKLFNKNLSIDLTQFFGNDINNYVRNPENFIIDAFTLLGKTQYHKNKLFNVAKQFGFNSEVNLVFGKPKIEKNKNNDLIITTESMLRFGNFNIATSSNKIQIKKQENGYSMQITSDIKLAKNNNNLKEIAKLFSQKQGNLSEKDLNNIRNILSKNVGESFNIEIFFGKINQKIRNEKGEIVERPIRTATITKLDTNLNDFQYYSMREMANMIDLLQDKTDMINFAIERKPERKDYDKLFTKMSLLGFAWENDNKENFIKFSEKILNELRNKSSPLYKKVENIVNNIKSGKNITKPLKEFLIKFYKEIKSPQSYDNFANAISEVYYKELENRKKDIKLTFTTNGMTKDGKRSRSQLVLDTFLMLTDVDNLRYSGIVKKERVIKIKK